MMKKHAITLAMMLIAFTSISQKYFVQVMSKENGTWGFCNGNGALIIPTKFRDSEEFNEEGWTVVKDENSQYFFLGIEGGSISGEALGVTKVKGGFHDGLVAIRIGSDWGYLNTAGKIVIPVKYGDVSEFRDGLASARRNGKYYILNTHGDETLIEGSHIDLVRHFSEKLAPFDDGSHFGFIDADGKVAIPSIYKGVGYFQNGLAWARDDATGRIGFLNPKGEWVFKPQFTFAINAHPDSQWTRCKDEEGWLYVNAAGKKLVVNDATAWGDFANGLAPGKKDGLWGFFDTSGRWIIEPRFDGIRDFQNGFAAAKRDGKWGMIDKSGNWIIQPVWGGIKDMAKIK